MLLLLYFDVSTFATLSYDRTQRCALSYEAGLLGMLCWNRPKDFLTGPDKFIGTEKFLSFIFTFFRRGA